MKVKKWVNRYYRKNKKGEKESVRGHYREVYIDDADFEDRFWKERTQISCIIKIMNMDQEKLNEALFQLDLIENNGEE